MKKKGFTLIELLAVIIILAVIALIATPVVLNVVDNAKKNANKNSVYGLIDGAKLYYADSLLDTNKSNNTNGTTNLIDEIKVSGTKPDSGYLYINSKGETALAVVYDNVCYTKSFSDNDLNIKEEFSNCDLDNYEIYKTIALDIYNKLALNDFEISHNELYLTSEADDFCKLMASHLCPENCPNTQYYYFDVNNEVVGIDIDTSLSIVPEFITYFSESGSGSWRVRMIFEWGPSKSDDYYYYGYIIEIVNGEIVSSEYGLYV